MVSQVSVISCKDGDSYKRTVKGHFRVGTGSLLVEKLNIKVYNQNDKIYEYVYFILHLRKHGWKHTKRITDIINSYKHVDKKEKITAHTTTYLYSSDRLVKNR